MVAAASATTSCLLGFGVSVLQGGTTMRARASLVLAVLLLGGGAALGADDFKVVVNASNPVTAVAQAQVVRMFLKQETEWSDGQPVVPVDQVDRSPVRAAFSRTILGREVAAVKSYWQRMIFSGTAVPPPEKATDDEVLAVVRSDPGAIGYVAPGAPLGAGVKVVKLQP